MAGSCLGDAVDGHRMLQTKETRKRAISPAVATLIVLDAAVYMKISIAYSGGELLC